MLVVSKSVEIIKDDQGITVAGVEVFEDITVRKQADQALQSSHQNLEMQMRYRTEQLSKINQMLIVEISEREKVQESIRMGNEKLKRVLTETISALASTVEKRDPYTAGHQERVAQLVLAIAKELNLPEEKIEGVKTAAMIHDIGKICVPAEILSKPSRLTSHEFSLITEHPQVGYDILKGIEFPWPVAKIVVQHHERLDGSGYPNKLKGDQILLEAWILIVSDVVEAMASHRPYRPALGVERALDEILSKKGILYLPSVVDACINIFLRKGFQFK
ncbi:MAG: HD domain-containing protein [Candidatus Omnitrophica bacterium]|nr:HD domain-containing protein [Candidatus Omnitrophota bacterium]